MPPIAAPLVTLPLVAPSLVAPPFGAEPRQATAPMSAALADAKWGALIESLPQAFYERALLLGTLLRQEAARITEHCGRLMTLHFGTTSPKLDRISVQEAIASLSPGARARSADLLIIADVLGCGHHGEIADLAMLTARALPRGGHCALLHWADGSQCGDSGEAGAEEFVRLAQPRLQPLLRRRTPEFRLDILERV